MICIQLIFLNVQNNQYNNVIENTLKQEQTNASLSTARAIFDNMGVVLPQGDIKTVYETIKTDNYMGWKSCTIQEAQAAADNGTAAIGISEDRIVVLSANDEEQPVAQTASAMTLDENICAYAVDGLRYYTYAYGSTNTTNASNYPYIDIPQDGDLGTSITYMGYHRTTSTSAPEGKLKLHAREHGRYSIANPEYYAMIDNRMVIATKANIGGNFPVSIGDYLDVTFEESDTGAIKVYHCIMGETKGAGAENNLWGHDDGKCVVEMLYHDYDPPTGYNSCRNNPWGRGRTKRITKVGNYGYFGYDG